MWKEGWQMTTTMIQTLPSRGYELSMDKYCLFLRELQKLHSIHYETIFVDLIIKKSQCEWGYSGGGKVGKVFLVVFSSALVRVEAPRFSAEVSSGFGIA